MYVCLCTGATSQAVNDAVAAGACTSKQVAAACGAGRDCGRCRKSVQAIINAHRERAQITAPDCGACTARVESRLALT
ncbi:hypothetical protein MANY_14710 [Mycolicibacterium anyangense]|uniref:Bacterioferritin-associated ferredoxin n=1 Tax=Mycolicibacterium anyangense TaxID=1431246 RepID=A0A6N4W7R2_9MYCO|nr:(2Fe-2S)-binding protein [Mycolicibacterium anyangense]BBZ76134.1 hypothetical protein MANY_14710 [Mycolicibacterium anyangense]